MRLTRATLDGIRYACLHFHYAHSVPANPLGYNVYNDADEWCGVILFAMGATPNIGKPYNLPIGGVLELVRVALNGKQEQTSRAVAMSLKQLKKDVPHCRLVVSYADCDQNHLGTIYQATNWVYTGTENRGGAGCIHCSRKENAPEIGPFDEGRHRWPFRSLSADVGSCAKIPRPERDNLLHPRKKEIPFPA